MARSAGSASVRGRAAAVSAWATAEVRRGAATAVAAEADRNARLVEVARPDSTFFFILASITLSDRLSTGTGDQAAYPATRSGTMRITIRTTSGGSSRYSLPAPGPLYF